MHISIKLVRFVPKSVARNVKVINNLVNHQIQPQIKEFYNSKEDLEVEEVHNLNLHLENHKQNLKPLHLSQMKNKYV